MSWERDNALEEAAKIAERWRDENRAAAAKARTREGRMERLGLEHPDMADMLDGAAIECNAIAGAIRELKGTPSNRPGWREPSLQERPF